MNSAHSVAAPDPNPRFEIAPNPAFVDQEVRIRLVGIQPCATVHIRASTLDDDHRRWSSFAEFRASSFGSIDVASDASLSGSYRGVSPMGLFWSMHLAHDHANGRAIFSKISGAPNQVEFSAEISSRSIASARLERLFLAPGIETRDLRIPADSSRELRSASAAVVPSDPPEGHLIARLFLPPPDVYRSTHPLPPVVIVLGGSGGGFDLDKAAVLSRHGFATLALAYFGVPPLPSWLHRVPLDYFEAALAWLAAQPDIDSRRVGILGVSRGAELALLLAATFPQIHAVVAFAPSSVAWSAGGRDNQTREIIPTWTFRGRPVPFAPLPLRAFMLRSAIPVVVLRRPVVFRKLFRRGLRNREAVARGAIPVEKIAGPVLLISGGDDHLWPAADMSEAILARLNAHHFAHAAEHLHYPRAGHMLRYPFLPTTSRESRNPHLRNAKFSYGGTPAADSDAQADSWPRAIAFLRSHL
jgi:dienelactone hydrolase